MYMDGTLLRLLNATIVQVYIVNEYWNLPLQLILKKVKG